jgi:UDP-2,3-diacylglucosamine hydrolase
MDPTTPLPKSRYSVLALNDDSRVHLCADLHLLPSTNLDGLVAWAKDFNAGDHVVILGDLFEAWVENRWGASSRHVNALNLLKQWSNQGQTVHLVMGNRDVLAGSHLHQATGMILHRDPLLLKMGKKKLLLIHGDELLPDDHSYQRFKRFVRHPLTLWLLKNCHLSVLNRLVGQTRRVSLKKTKRLADMVFQPTARGIKKLLEACDCDQLLAGHLHRHYDFFEKTQGREIHIQIMAQSFGWQVYGAIFQKGELKIRACEENSA